MEDDLNGWMPIDSAPKDNEHQIDLWVSYTSYLFKEDCFPDQTVDEVTNYYRVANCHWDGDEWRDEKNDKLDKSPIYWRPAPPKPKIKNGDKLIADLPDFEFDEKEDSE